MHYSGLYTQSHKFQSVHAAVKAEDVNEVKRLVSFGANACEKNAEGKTPYDVAYARFKEKTDGVAYSIFDGYVNVSVERSENMMRALFEANLRCWKQS